MSENATSTTPDPELFMADDPKRPVQQPAEKVLSGAGVRGEVAGCPTGLADDPKAQQPQQAGGGGAPGTGVPVKTPPSPGEGVTEKTIKKSGDDR